MAKTTKKREEVTNLIDKLDIDESTKQNLLIFLLEAYSANKFIDFSNTIKASVLSSAHYQRINLAHRISDVNEGEISDYVRYIGPHNVENNYMSSLNFLSNFEKDLIDRLNRQENQNQLVYKEIENLRDEVNNLKKENTQIKNLMFSCSAEQNDFKVTQTLPIDIYIDTNKPEEIFEVYSATLKFMTSIGFEKAFEFEPIKGSWYKRILGKSIEKLTSQDVIDRLKEAEYGIEVNTILKQQSEIDKNQSEALANIITSLKDIPNAAIRVGALIVVKLTNDEGSVSLQTRTLSIKELHLLNKKPELLQMPKQILQALAKEIEDDETPKISEN